MTSRTPVPQREAIADLVGAICYALLKSFQITARGATAAPSIDLAERQADFAVDEFKRYKGLRAHLDTLTEVPVAAMEVFRDPVDAFYASANADGWMQTQVFHFVGDTITTDFSSILATKLEPPTAEAVAVALTGRTEQEAFALEQIEHALATEGAAGRERIEGFTRAMVGSALNRFRDALLASGTVEQVLGGPDGVKDCVLELLGRHRERLSRLGLDQLD